MNDYQPCDECGELEASVHHGSTSGRHAYVPGCYCGDRGKCEVCVERARDHADALRKAAKEG